MFREAQQIGVYTLIRKLGEGGFGEVWLAENRNSPNEKVAIKLPRTDQIDLQAVKDEIFNWILSGKHKNILPIIECETFNNQIAIVSEYAPDDSLQDLINKKGVLPISEAVEITIGILDGLAHLHNRKIIHRDLKPDNVLFQGNVPRLTDFGISRAMSVSSQSQTVSGTLSYMAPETFDGKRNTQTDIWAVGVILYQLLTGNLPFPQKEMMPLIKALAMKDPAPLPASIPPDLQTIVKKALAKELPDRYKTADEMAKELREFLQKNSEETLKIPLYDVPATESTPIYEIPPTEASPKIDETFTYKSDSVVTDVKVAFETKEPITPIRPVVPQPKTDSNTYIFYGLGLFLLLIFGVIYWSSKSNNEIANNSSTISNIKTSPTVTPSPIPITKLIPFRKGDRFGFIDENRKMVIEPKYDDVHPFSEGLASVKFNNKYGFIDETGKEVIPLKYEYANSFSEGLAEVKLGYYGFIDKTGKEVTPLKYYVVHSFSEGLAAVRDPVSRRYGFIDKTGNEVISLRYESAYLFSQGLAYVRLNGKVGFIDKTGKEIIPFQYEEVYPFSEGLASVKLNNKYGFIDKTGKEIIPPKYDLAYSFSEGLSRVELNGKKVFIDKTGKEAISLRKYEYVYSFSEGLATVSLNKKYGFIDKKGKEVIPLKYDPGSIPFSNGITRVTLNGKDFYIDKNGTEYYEP